MANLKSCHVNITERQHEAISAYALAKEISFSEALRRITDQWLDNLTPYANMRAVDMHDVQ